MKKVPDAELPMPKAPVRVPRKAEAPTAADKKIKVIPTVYNGLLASMCQLMTLTTRRWLSNSSAVKVLVQDYKENYIFPIVKIAFEISSCRTGPMNEYLYNLEISFSKNGAATTNYSFGRDHGYQKTIQRCIRLVNEKYNKIANDICTTHGLILDGIKRDRMPWMGDLAVSVPASAYAFPDAEVAERGLVALGQNPTGYVNGILDYSLWWLICTAEYARHFDADAYLAATVDRVDAVVRALAASRPGTTACCGPAPGRTRTTSRCSSTGASTSTRIATRPRCRRCGSGR